ncbi:hypothetical protein DFP72DRAFT_852639 [Ephemerocybe angulata]|uniref:Uncharacterized protein n=1 Tax=Ephemerocybe angulata TaxID=980116 RepID=A0A8H6HNV8_9AGAR|nr:hypothetical protein DFP72DRAFT_852639 [Tulosesus angulatus]
MPLEFGPKSQSDTAHGPQSPKDILSFDTALGFVAIIAGLEQTEKALEWLEQDLFAHNKELSQNVSDTAKQLETAGSSRGQPNVSMSLTGRYPWRVKLVLMAISPIFGKTSSRRRGRLPASNHSGRRKDRRNN